MILGLKHEAGDSYWFGKVDGQEKKYIRVLAGIMLPVYERQFGALVVLGERYNRIRPEPSFEGLAASVGEWGALERALMEHERDYQFRDLIIDDDKQRPLLWKIRGLNPLVLTAAGPSYAVSEIGRQKTDQLIEQGKLHVEPIRSCLESEMDMAPKALQVALCYALEYPALYRAKPKAQLDYKHMAGTKRL